MNFLSMEYFAAVADKRNFTRAADQLHITQQTLSAHIASLERELNCQLFLRRSPLELTYAGQVFLRYALQFQQDYQALKHEFCDITANQRGLLRVGIAYTRGRVIMPRVIPAFQTVYPNIQVDLLEASNDELHARLLDGTVDLAVAAFAHSVPEIELQPFYQEEVCMLVPRPFCLSWGTLPRRALWPPRTWPPSGAVPSPSGSRRISPDSSAAG